MYALPCGLDGCLRLLRLRSPIAYKFPRHILSEARFLLTLRMFGDVIFASHLAQGRRCARHGRSMLLDLDTADIAARTLR